MKKLLMSLFFIFSLILLFGNQAGAVGTVTQSIKYLPNVQGYYERATITLSWTADSKAATIPNTTLAISEDPSEYHLMGWYLYEVETDPGGTAPTDLYDIVINDANGLDITDGQLMNRSTTATQIVRGINALIPGDLTVVWSNQAVNSATGTIILRFIAN